MSAPPGLRESCGLGTFRLIPRLMSRRQALELARCYETRARGELFRRMVVLPPGCIAWPR